MKENVSDLFQMCAYGADYEVGGSQASFMPLRNHCVLNLAYTQIMLVKRCLGLLISYIDESHEVWSVGSMMSL